MDHRSIWEATATRRRYAPLSGDARADVAVIGAGITGLTTALLLKKAGKRVVVLDASHVGGGTSGHTTAHVSTLWDPGYSRLAKQYGDGVAAQVAGCLREGLECIGWLAAEHRIDCGLERVPGYRYIERGQDAKQVEREFRAARTAGLDVTWTREVPLPFATSGGFVVPDQAQLHALDYLEGLAGAVDGDGCSVHEHSRVTAIHSRPCRAQTEAGTLTADRMVLATHTPLGVSPLHTAVAPQRSYALAARVSEALPAALFWDAAEPYHYLRIHEIDGTPWLIAGGEDRKTAHGEEAGSMAALRRWVDDHFEVLEVGQAWSSQLYEPSDHLPFIGRSPFTPDVFVATGFSGDGLPFGSVAGLILRDLLTGVDNPHARLLRPERLHLKALPTFVKENADVMTSFVLDRLPGRDAEREIAGLAPGEGAIAGRGPSKVAVYRADDGSLSRFSAVCPHLKCIVRWNAARGSFDCPCHGSRFASDGSVIEGPALRGLTKLDD